jgi:hypothetical protein
VFGGLSLSASAGSLCDYYRSSTSKTFYNHICSPYNSTKPAGAQNTLSDALKINTSSIPTGPTGYGVEALYSILKRNPTPDNLRFGLVRGFNRAGAALSLGSGDTFYENDILRRQYHEPNLENFEFYNPSLNIGAAATLVQFTKGVQLKLGLSAHYVDSTESWGGGTSILFETPWISVGTGISRLRVADDIPRINFISSLARLRLFLLELEYNRLDSQDTFDLGPVQIVTASLRMRAAIATFARRHSRYARFGKVFQNYYAFQYLFNDNLSLGYINNYVPGAHTFALQFFF